MESLDGSGYGRKGYSIKHLALLSSRDAASTLKDCFDLDRTDLQSIEDAMTATVAYAVKSGKTKKIDLPELKVRLKSNLKKFGVRDKLLSDTDFTAGTSLLMCQAINNTIRAMSV